MSLLRVCACLAMAATVATAGCKPKVVPAPPVVGDTVVLEPDPEDGTVGAASVSTPSGSVELATAHHATRAVAGQAPTAPAPMSGEEIQRRFGDAISARPLPPREFTLHFESGDETLTLESQALVAEIVEFVRQRPAPDVTVIGHTDTTGDTEANIGLGMRRGALIRDLLVKSGLDPAQVDVASHGEADPVVPTPDNTPEPKNRRVEVTVR